MTPDPRVCELFASLLVRPDSWYPALLRCRRDLSDRMGQDAAQMLDGFADRVEDLTLDDRQELFALTFESDPRGRLERAGEDSLPDRLARLGRVPPREAALLVSRDILPDIERILAMLEGRRNPYEALFKAIVVFLSGLGAPPA